jgi:hypothetical protein
VNGTQAAIWSLGMIGAYLDWEVPFDNPLAGWQEHVAANAYRIEVRADGGVDLISNS